ncbi:MAG: UDP-3-O-acyl-N-acetylglucosamine deacetylase [Gammaproteobacteria bacterium]|nr:UDP-3-O-acyl-N-acetylglucosamine deacetylase [Gammaproteobacteria bacterium]
MVKQRTLGKVIKATGITMHGGERAELALCPAPANSGIIFERVDLDATVEIPAKAAFVGDTVLNTTLVKDNVCISTVEHLMSAFAGLGIDNARVQVNTRELPIMDGSASPFVFLIQSAGIVEQAAEKRFIRIKKPISVTEAGKSISLEPYNGFKVAFTLDYDHPYFQGRPQEVEVDFSNASFIDDISRARTFGFMADYEQLQALNLAKGASLDNAIVIGDYRIANEGGLRYDNEFARHKVLDAIGDIYLLGHQLIGCLRGYKSGHALNSQLRQKLLETADAWEYVSYPDSSALPIRFVKPALVTA